MVVVVYKKLKNNDHKKLKGGRCGEKALSIESYYGIESLLFFQFCNWYLHADSQQI